jgi:gamma-glutamyltranspeptidase
MAMRADGARWAIATPHTAATDAGVAAFERGGSAVDAALAAATTLAVAYPHMCGVGGDLFALVQQGMAAPITIASSGRSPAGADPTALARMPAMPIRGPVPITVPGAVAGWAALHRSGARLPWGDAFTTAIGLATDGVEVSGSLAGELAEPGAPFRDDPGLGAIFFPTGEPATVGSVVRQPALARTLELLATEGPDALYRGPVGRAYAAGLAEAGSPLTVEDLATHEATLVEPLRLRFRDLEVRVAPPNSQGFVLLQILALLERLGLEPDLDGPDVAKIARVIDGANGDRDLHLADPDRMRIRPQELLVADHLATILEHPEMGEPARPHGDTIALVAADAGGNAVSLIQSLFWGFGAGILEPATGIVAQNRGACFTLEPGHPNAFAPGARPFHTLMPALVHDDAGLAGVAGTMGGYQQPQINLHTITRTFVGGHHPAEAVAAPRWVVLGSDEGNARPVVGLEPGVPAATKEILATETGFDQLEADGFGHAHLIRRSSAGFSVGSDPRADGSAAAG